MIFIATIVQLLGFYILYNTSLRADLQTRVLRKWAQRYRTAARLAGATLIIISFLLFATAFSVATGLVTGTLVLMTVATLVIILYPLRSL